MKHFSDHRTMRLDINYNKITEEKKQKPLKIKQYISK